MIRIRFAAMIATSTLVMFLLMYLNTYALSPVMWSETRACMTVIMGASMAIVMLSFMWKMYKIRAANLTIAGLSVVAILGGLYLVRSQITVQDVSWMKSMMPHHSIAVLTSERAGIEDLRVRKLADGIIEAQRREIKEMNWLINDIEAIGVVTKKQDAQARTVPELD